MFRIDKAFVAYDHTETVYTNVNLEAQNDLQVKKLKNDTGEQERLKVKQQFLDKAREDAEAILLEAREQAKRITEEAERKGKEVLSQAQEKGYSQGRKKAAEEAQLCRRREEEEVNGLLSRIEQARDSVIDELEQDIISLIFQIVKKVINIQMEKDDKIFEELVKNALGKIRKEGKIIIRVSPEEYKLFHSGNAQFVINNERIQATIVEEPLYSRGDLLVESEGETINGGIDLQIGNIELAFREHGNIA